MHNTTILQKVLWNIYTAMEVLSVGINKLFKELK